MRRLHKYTTPNIVSGTTRLKRVFAFIPTVVDDTTVWLEHYEILQVYLVVEVIAIVDGAPVKFANGNWQDISKRLRG
jgi:hypothetical protein